MTDEHGDASPDLSRGGVSSKTLIMRLRPPSLWMAAERIRSLERTARRRPWGRLWESIARASTVPSVISTREGRPPMDRSAANRGSGRPCSSPRRSCARGVACKIRAWLEVSSISKGLSDPTGASARQERSMPITRLAWRLRAWPWPTATHDSI